MRITGHLTRDWEMARSIDSVLREEFQAALDSAHPAPKEGSTPEMDALLKEVLSILKQYHDGHIHLVDLEGFLFGAFEPARPLELRLAEKVRTVEHMTELVQQQSKTLGIIKDSECSLRTRLRELEEDKVQLEALFERGEVVLGRSENGDVMLKWRHKCYYGGDVGEAVVAARKGEPRE